MPNVRDTCLSSIMLSEFRSWQGALDTILCDKVCQWLGTGQWFSLGIPVSSTNKTDRHNMTEILLKVALNTINQEQNTCICELPTFVKCK